LFEPIEDLHQDEEKDDPVILAEMSREKKVVIKVTVASRNRLDLRPARIFAKEVSILKSMVDCANIVDLVGVCEWDGKLAFVLEYLERRDLTTVIANGDLRDDWGKKVGGYPRLSVDELLYALTHRTPSSQDIGDKRHRLGPPLLTSLWRLCSQVPK
jgi:serine/threonine protein kinase